MTPSIFAVRRILATPELAFDASPFLLESKVVRVINHRYPPFSMAGWQKQAANAFAEAMEWP